MQKLTGAERVINTIKGKPVDRIPVSVYDTVQLRGHVQLPGVTLENSLTNAEQNAKLQLAFHEHFPVDLYTLNGATSSCVAQACGSEIEAPETQPKKHILEDKSNLAELKLPDPSHDGRLPYILKMYEIITSAIKDPLIRAQVCWPWTIAGVLRGIDKLIYDTADDPDFVRKLMRYCTDTSMIITLAIDKVIPKGCAFDFTEPSAGCNLISPKIYREFVKAYHEEIMRNPIVKERITSLHICGNINPIMADLLELGIDILDVDAPSSLEKALLLAKGKTAICGNVPTIIFAQGSQKDIDEAVKKCIDAGKAQGFILAPGCSLPQYSLYENVKRFMEVGWEYGRYNS